MVRKQHRPYFFEAFTDHLSRPAVDLVGVHEKADDLFFGGYSSYFYDSPLDDVLLSTFDWHGLCPLAR